MDPLDLIGFIIGIVGFVWGISSFVYSNRKSARYYKELRRVTWDEMRLGSRKLRKTIEQTFHPTIFFTPCRRGATIANLMFDIEENVLLYVGIRKDKRGEGVSDFVKSMKNDWEVVETGKYFHYIPKALVNFMNNDAKAELLILDDYAMTGDSLRNIVDFLLKKGVEPEKIKTATLICTTASCEGKKMPDFYWLKTEYSEFYFPWGKAV
jgi:hypoxanthine phosphoribosyltransferase